MGQGGTDVKDQGCRDLVSEYEEQRARFQRLGTLGTTVLEQNHNSTLLYAC